MLGLDSRDGSGERQKNGHERVGSYDGVVAMIDKKLVYWWEVFYQVLQRLKTGSVPYTGKNMCSQYCRNTIINYHLSGEKSVCAQEVNAFGSNVENTSSLFCAASWAAHESQKGENEIEKCTSAGGKAAVCDIGRTEQRAHFCCAVKYFVYHGPLADASIFA